MLHYKENIKGYTIYTLILLIHLFCAIFFIGFIFTDVFILSKIKKTLKEDENAKARTAIYTSGKRVMPFAVLLLFLSGLFLFSQDFGTIKDGGLSHFQILLLIKVFLAFIIFLKVFLEVVVKKQLPCLKGHVGAAILAICIVILAKIMWVV